MKSDDIVGRLRDWARGAEEQGVADVVLGLNCAADEIERLRAERDEARREIVILLAGTSILEMERFANERGWDCFKEETNETDR